MFTREEASRIRHEFWTTFGKYMSPIPSSEGSVINWINYHTGVKDIYFRMNADKHGVTICISIESSERAVREVYFDQFMELEILLHNSIGETWDWQREVGLSEGKIVSQIGTALSGVSVFNRDDWPAIISFLKPRIIALDAFWENAKYNFLALG